MSVLAARPSLAGETLTGRLLTAAEARPHARFLSQVASDGSELLATYGDLLARSERWAGLFRHAGIDPGEPLVLVLRPGLDLYAAFLGALRVGALPSVFYYPSPKFARDRYLDEMRRLLATNGARLVVAYGELAGDLSRLAGALPHSPAVVTEADAHAAAPFATVPDLPPESVAFMQYSSGTTGLKKGLQLAHRPVLWQLDAYAEALQLGDEEVVASWLPLYHDMGLIACMLLPMSRGLPIVGMSPHAWVARPAMWLEAVARHRATRAWMPNFALALLARRCAGGGHDLSSLRSLTNCSEPVLAATHDAFVAAFAAEGLRPEALQTSYAMAETTFAVTQSQAGRDPVRDSVDPQALAGQGQAVSAAGGKTLLSSGRALPDTEIEIRDATGERLGERAVGQIFVRSPSLFEGYHNNDAATSAAFAGGLYATGDLGYLAAGELYVVGRASDTIVVGGQNVYPQDVEAAVQEVVGVAPGRVVAFGIADERLGTERLVVMAERAGSGPPDETVRADAYASVASSTRVTVADIRLVPPRTLVKSSSGKLSRRANRDLYLTEQSPCSAKSALEEPEVPRERFDTIETVRRVVRQCLARTPAIGPVQAAAVEDDTSLIAGGLIDSFGLVDLVSALEEATGRPLPLSLMSDPDAMDSIRSIARILETHVGAELPSAMRVPQALEDIALRHPAAGNPRFGMGFWSLYYRLVFRRHGISYGGGLRVLGPLLLRLDGDARNIRFGRNATLMPWVDLKVREAGWIEVGDDVVLDTCARLVAAREGAVVLGDRVQLAMGTIVNAGDLVVFGRDSGMAAHGNVIASEHRIDGAGAFMDSGYVRKPVLVGEGVWIAASCLLRPGARIGDRAVIGAHSVVEGDIPAGAVAMGQPARPIRFRT